MSPQSLVQILCIEDDAATARLLQKKLTRSGYLVDLASDGFEGLAAWGSKPYDLVTVDHDMPGMPGLEVVRGLASRGPLPPTVMITGAGNETVAVEAMKLGADDYIIKDSEARYLDLIPSVVERALEKRRLLAEKSRSEEKLRESENLLKKSQEIAHVGFWDLDLVTNRLVWSDEVYRIFGLAPQEFAATYEDFLRTVHPEDHEAVDAAYSRSVREGKDYYEIEHRIVRQSTGEIRHVHEKCQHIRDTSGNIVRSVGMVQDITDRKKVEQALRESESRLSSYLNSINKMGLGISVVDRNYMIRHMNSVMISWFGNHIGKICHEAIAGLGAPCPGCQLENVIDGSQIVHYQPTTPDGRTFDIVAAQVRETDGSVSKMEIIADITERKLAGEKIKEQKEFLDTVIESLTHPFYVIDANDYTIRKANSAAAAAGIAENSTCYTITHQRSTPCDGVDHPCPLLEAKKTGRPVTVEHVHYDEKGEARNVEVHCFPIVDSNGSVETAIEYSLDITERKKAQEALLQAEKSRALDDLTAGVAHNFNNLLQVITGNANLGLMILESGDLSDLKEALERMIESARFGAETVRRLSRYARGREDSQAREMEVFDLSDVVRQAVEMSGPWWKSGPMKKGVRIAVDARLNRGCTMRGNKNEMFEVMVNLIKNAVEAMGDGGDLEISTAVAATSLVLRVRDTGIGIPEENVNRLFTPFFTTHLDAGRGLGLATTRRIIDAHGGRIFVKSIAGSGSTFTIKLPYVPPVSVSQNVPKDQESERTLTILVVDDLAATVRMLKAGLERSGNNVLTALSGEEALAAFKRNQIDLIICDLAMPDMDGWQVGSALKAICQESMIPKPPFIILTGWEDQGNDKQHMLESGVDAVVEKPVDIRRLRQIVGEVVRNGKQSPTVRPEG